MIPSPASAGRKQATKRVMDANAIAPKAARVVTSAQAVGRMSRRKAQVVG